MLLSYFLLLMMYYSTSGKNAACHYSRSFLFGVALFPTACSYIFDGSNLVATTCCIFFNVIN